MNIYKYITYNFLSIYKNTKRINTWVFRQKCIFSPFFYSNVECDEFKNPNGIRFQYMKFREVAFKALCLNSLDSIVFIRLILVYANSVYNHEINYYT